VTLVDRIWDAHIDPGQVADHLHGRGATHIQWKRF
jgi:hypothetical protein